MFVDKMSKKIKSYVNIVYLNRPDKYPLLKLAFIKDCTNKTAKYNDHTRTQIQVKPKPNGCCTTATDNLVFSTWFLPMCCMMRIYL